jgi:hypothetical protein
VAKLSLLFHGRPHAFAVAFGAGCVDTLKTFTTSMQEWDKNQANRLLRTAAESSLSLLLPLPLPLLLLLLLLLLAALGQQPQSCSTPAGGLSSAVSIDCMPRRPPALLLLLLLLCTVLQHDRVLSHLMKKLLGCSWGGREREREREGEADHCRR